MLFEGPYLPTPITFSELRSVARGQRFLILKPVAQQQAPTQINVALNLGGVWRLLFGPIVGASRDDD
jgi:hypothetical protein